MRHMESDREYLNRRAREEEAAAERASSDKVRRLHMELAARYRKAASADPELRVAETAARPGLPNDLRILE